MSWEAEYTDEFGQWWQTFSESQQDAGRSCRPGDNFSGHSGRVGLAQRMIAAGVALQRL